MDTDGTRRQDAPTAADPPASQKTPQSSVAESHPPDAVSPPPTTGAETALPAPRDPVPAPGDPRPAPGAENHLPTPGEPPFVPGAENPPPVPDASSLLPAAGTDGPSRPARQSQWPLTLCLLVAAAGLVILWFDDWRNGVLIFAGGVALAAVLRAALSDAAAGLLHVRNRAFDITFLTLTAAAIAILALIVPN